MQPVGDGTLTAYYDYSDRAEIDYQDLSIDIVRRRGREWDNWFPNWDAAIAAAQACAASGGNDAIACDDAYWNASGLRKDDLGYVALDLPLGETLEWKTTAYGTQNDGQGLWGTPYTPTPGGAPLSIRTTEYDLEAQGVVTALTWTGGAHEVNGGVWYETNDFTQARRFYGEPSIAGPTRDFTELPEQSVPDGLGIRLRHRVVRVPSAGHVVGHGHAAAELRLPLGARREHGEDGRRRRHVVKNGTIEADEPFLPQVGFNWSISDDMEWFGSAARNVRAFASSGTSGPFSTTAAGFERDPRRAGAGNRRQLRDRSALPRRRVRSAGRAVSRRLQGSAASASTPAPGIVGNPSVLANVGSVTTNGAEAAVTWRPLQIADVVHVAGVERLGVRRRLHDDERGRRDRASCRSRASRSRTRRRSCSSRS